MTISIIFFFKQKTAYEMRISDWSSDVCSSDLDQQVGVLAEQYGERKGTAQALQRTADRLFRRRARLDLAADEMGGHFGIGLRFKAAPAGLKDRKSVV